MRARRIHIVPAAVLAAVFFLMAPAAPAGDTMEELKKGWEDLKESFRNAPEEMRADGEKTWEGAKEDAANAAEKSKEAVDDAGRDAKKGWEEVTDAVKSQE
jgi:hypothetical protein